MLHPVKIKLSRLEVEHFQAFLLNEIRAYPSLLDMESTNHLVLTELYERKIRMFSLPKDKQTLELRASELKACFHLFSKYNHYLVTQICELYQQMIMY